MEKMLPRKRSFLAVGVSLLLTLVLSGTALTQQIAVSGTVSSASGTPLRGVTVRVQGTEIRAFTNSNGRYAIAAPSDGVLNFTLLGQRAANQTIGGRTSIDVTMEPIAFLEEVVVTAYSEEQRRGEITGAVSGVNLDAVSRQTGASVLQRLDAAVPGVTVDASGSPGSRSTVRIRGVSSFQNNDPLYIVDGTPVNDSYINWLNPNDIASVQVLKDASSASIYGSRASNGVIIIETTKRGVGGPPRATLRVRTGVASPVKGYDDFLITNALDYAEVVRLSYVNAGEPVPTNIYGDPNSPTLPAYTYAAPGTVLTTDAWGRPLTVDPNAYAVPGRLIMGASAGTNWWKEVFSPAPVADYNLDVNGGSEDNAYGVSFNYFDQTGTAAYNRFKRGSVRVNTSFNRNRFNFGENISLGLERGNGGLPNDPGGYAEDGILGKNILMQPIIPVYDISGNFASGKAATLGNQTNPLKFAYGHKDDENKTNRIFGNTFAGYDITPELSVRTKLGFNVGQQNQVTFNPTIPENSEANLKNSFNERTDQFIDWTLSNTAKYVRNISRHNVSVLLGQEANRITTRFNFSGISGLINEDVNSRYLQDFLGDASSLTVNSGGSKSALLSVFGKVDYSFADRYVASVTMRKDGSSRMAPGHRWGTFPAFGLGWRLSQEPFMADNKLFSDVMLRFGWGVTGNQNIPGGRSIPGFGGTRGDTYYDITGSNTSVVTGFKQTSLGNADLKWEESRSTNVGADVAMFDGAVNVVLDVYTRNTDNLLFDPPQPGTAGTAAPPIVNVGKMRNTGFDFSIGHRAAAWNVTLNGSHYNNKIVSIDGVQDFFYGPITTRYGNQIINKVGHPIGSFYGLVTDGFFNSSADSAAHKLDPVTLTCPTAPCQSAPAPGRFKFKDTDDDGVITLADRTIIGSPHPDFTAGLDMGYRRGDWDLSATLFGTFGNEIFDVQKEFYIFRNFSTNVRKDLVANSWSPTHLDAKYPRIDKNDSQSNQVSNFYVEDGSYVRLRNVQLGYSVPPKYSRWLSATRLYVQAENLFTITGYDGLDPALPAANVFGPAGDIRDQYRGIDRGTYPNNRTFSFGLITNF
jgi:TonB-dependent starch-binding outer membrane protein SusC